MDLSWTPRAKFPRKKFISPSPGAPYRSPLLHNLPVPEKKVQSSFENTSDELKIPAKAFEEKNDATKEKLHQVQQKFVSPVATSSYRSPLTCSMPLERKVLLPSKTLSLDELRSSTMELFEKNEDLKEKIHHLEQEGFTEEKLKAYIDKLHSYNEMKDFAQPLVERLAILEQKTIKEVFKDLGIKEND